MRETRIAFCDFAFDDCAAHLGGFSVVVGAVFDSKVPSNFVNCALGEIGFLGFGMSSRMNVVLGK